MTTPTPADVATTSPSLGGPLPGSLEPADVAAADAAGYAKASFGNMPRGAWAWSLFQGGRDPYVILITIYIWAPYFTSAVVGDPVKGQALIAMVSTLNSIFIALTAPFLGAAIDRYGARKPLMFAIVALMTPLIFSLWFAKPGGAGLPMVASLWIVGLIGILFAYCEVVHNAMLMDAAGPRHAPQASGLALSAGNFVSVITLVFCLFAFALPGNPATASWPLIPDKPLFGLDPLMAEPSRIVAPIAAVLLAALAIPLFLFTPDAPRSGLRFATALRQGASHLKQTLKGLKDEKDAAVYLFARMLFNDGMTALLIFGGIYAAGVMQWGVLELLAYGILLSIFGVIGGFTGAWLDNLLGPRKAVQLAISGALVCIILQLGMAHDRILFFWPYDVAAHAPLWNGPVFTHLPDLVYLVNGFFVAIFVVAHYASSRTLLTRLVPAEKLPSFFGLYALSGTVTVWIGSLLVSIFTALIGTQQGGFVPIAGLLLAGLIGMFFVKGGGKQTA